MTGNPPVLPCVGYAVVVVDGVDVVVVGVDVVVVGVVVVVVLVVGLAVAVDVLTGLRMILSTRASAPALIRPTSLIVSPAESATPGMVKLVSVVPSG